MSYIVVLEIVVEIVVEIVAVCNVDVSVPNVVVTTEELTEREFKGLSSVVTEIIPETGGEIKHFKLRNKTFLCRFSPRIVI